METFYETPQETADGLEQKVDELNRRLEEAEAENRTAAKEVLGDVSQSMGGSISFAGSAGQQVAMDLTRGVLQGGTRFISQRVKAVKVKLKAGYRVLLVTKKQ